LEPSQAVPALGVWLKLAPGSNSLAISEEKKEENEEGESRDWKIEGEI
jgi:hypothetical protein